MNIGMTNGSVERSASGCWRTFDAVEDEAVTDEDLIERFVGHGGAERDRAFRAMLERHGPMVLSVCRTVLGDVHDAEDAFQTAFFTFARKARTIRDRRALGRWLFEVAQRTAMRTRARAIRRAVQERKAAQMSASVDELHNDWHGLLPMIHEEIDRLPANYRTPVALCYVEGKTHEAAARMLAWPLGTVKGRLLRARGLLQSRLARRGVALGTAWICAFLAESSTSW
jgi:RNA polymerase sigma factor (sigma-70 family)